MPKNNKNFNRDLEGFLRARGFNRIIFLDTDGKSVPDPAEADQFRFNYRNGPYDYGTVTVTTNNGKVTVYYNESAVRGKDSGVDSEWTKFLKKLKDWSLRYGQMGFDVQNIDKLGSEMKKRKVQKNEEQLLEGWYGNKNTSWSDGTPTIKMVVKHSKQIEEGDLRYHHIEKIFLENSHGERILVPSKKPSVGRAFARHLAEGGQYNDERWNHIKDLAEDISKLGGFVRATRSGVFNESVSVIVKEAAAHYESLRSTIRKLGGSRGYSTYFESWQPALMEEDGAGDFAGMFMSNTLDPRIERAIPVLSKLKINLGEITEAEEFSEWADNIVEGLTPELNKKIDELSKLLSGDSELPVGADALSVKGQLEPLIDNEKDREDLFAELEDLANSDPDNDAKPAIITWMQKNRGDKFYEKVLDGIGEGPIGGGGAVAKAPAPAAPAPAAPAAPAPAAPDAAMQSLMPAPLAERSTTPKKVKQRNFVAKNAPKSGAGAHGKKGYQRHPKHKTKLEESMDDESSPVKNAIVNRILRVRTDLLKYGMDELIGAIDDVASDVGEVSEIGTSDVSIWVKRVEEMLSNQHVDGEEIGRIKKLSGL